MHSQLSSASFPKSIQAIIIKSISHDKALSLNQIHFVPCDKTIIGLFLLLIAVIKLTDKTNRSRNESNERIKSANCEWENEKNFA